MAQSDAVDSPVKETTATAGSDLPGWTEAFPEVQWTPLPTAILGSEFASPNSIARDVSVSPPLRTLKGVLRTTIQRIAFQSTQRAMRIPPTVDMVFNHVKTVVITALESLNACSLRETT